MVQGRDDGAQRSAMHCIGSMESECESALAEAALQNLETGGQMPTPTHSYYDRIGAALEILKVHEGSLKVHRR